MAHTNIKFNLEWIIDLTIKPKAIKLFSITQKTKSLLPCVRQRFLR